mmetsp:Transcript_10/g.36  ORF Transcript_10/g.36 Transcript_10/m.36 type:complete len:224 (+) Transcript_10:702-1373(+)
MLVLLFSLSSPPPHPRSPPPQHARAWRRTRHARAPTYPEPRRMAARREGGGLHPPATCKSPLLSRRRRSQARTCTQCGRQMAWRSCRRRTSTRHRPSTPFPRHVRDPSFRRLAHFPRGAAAFRTERASSQTRAGCSGCRLWIFRRCCSRPQRRRAARDGGETFGAPPLLPAPRSWTWTMRAWRTGCCSVLRALVRRLLLLLLFGPETCAACFCVCLPRVLLLR